MEFSFRKFGGAYLDITVYVDQVSVKTGLMDVDEATKLLNNIKDAVEYIEWYINSVSEE